MARVVNVWEVVVVALDLAKMPGSTTLWSRNTLGSPETPTGYFIVAAAIRCHTGWMRDEFWPWFVRAVLGMDLKTDYEKVVQLWY